MSDGAVTGRCPGCDGTPLSAAERVELEREWLHLTRATLPALALDRSWPVKADHCFQRILLDNALGGRWYDHVAARPAYRHVDAEALDRAVELARAAVQGEVDLTDLNRRSLAWRGRR
jgi:hypothetical protein